MKRKSKLMWEKEGEIISEASGSNPVSLLSRILANLRIYVKHINFTTQSGGYVLIGSHVEGEMTLKKSNSSLKCSDRCPICYVFYALLDELK